MELPTEGTIVSSSYNEEFNVTQWTLSNGAQVASRPTDFQTDRIVLVQLEKGESLGARPRHRVAKTNELAYYGCNGLDGEDIERLMTGVQGRLNFKFFCSQQMRFGFRDDLKHFCNIFGYEHNALNLIRKLERIREWHHTQIGQSFPIHWLCIVTVS